MLGPSHHTYIFRTSFRSHVSSCLYRTSCHANFYALIGRPQGREICPTRQRSDPKKSSSLQGRCSSVQEGRLQKEGLRYSFRGETSRRFDRTAWQTSREEGCGRCCSRPKGIRSDWLHDDPTKDRKRVRRSTCRQAISALSEQGQVRRAGRQASTQTTVHVTGSGRIDGAFIFESPHSRLCHLHHARTRTFPCAREFRRSWKTVAARAWTRVEAVRGRPEWRWRHKRQPQTRARSRKGQGQGEREREGR